MTMRLVGNEQKFVGLSTDKKPIPPEKGQDSRPLFASFWELDTGRTYHWRPDKGWVEIKIPTDTSVLSALQLVARQLEQVQRMLAAAHDLDVETIEAE